MGLATSLLGLGRVDRNMFLSIHTLACQADTWFQHFQYFLRTAFLNLQNSELESIIVSYWAMSHYYILKSRQSIYSYDKATCDTCSHCLLLCVCESMLDILWIQSQDKSISPICLPCVACACVFVCKTTENKTEHKGARKGGGKKQRSQVLIFLLLV